MKSSQPVVMIIGLGLLGASLALSLRGKYHRTAWTRNILNLNKALEDHVIDEKAFSIEDGVKKADIIVLCLPVPEIINTITQIAPFLKENAIVTDVGSTKQQIVEHAETILSKTHAFFIGSHPMTGTEQSGYEALVDGLYQNSTVLITPTSQTPLQPKKQLINFWENIGCKVIELSTEKHDQLVARTSHLAHLLAMNLVLTTLDCDSDTKTLRYNGCAGGFRDSTRIASSSAAMWRTVIESNQQNIIPIMNEFEEQWHHIKKMIEEHRFDEFEATFEKAKKIRAEWLESRFSNND